MHNALLNAGGDIGVLGNKHGSAWRIAIKHPRNNGIVATLDVASGEFVFTSGDYERFFDYQGRRYHHVLDPTTGWPSTGLQSVTVVAHDGTLADILTTAMLAAGATDWQSVWRARPEHIKNAGVMAVDAAGEVWINTPMQKRLTFDKPAPITHRIRP